MAQAAPNRCEFTYERWKIYKTFVWLWTMLIFFFIAFFLGLIALTAVLLVDGKDVGGIFTILGGVTDFAIVVFAQARRKEAQEQEEAAARWVLENCPEYAPKVRAIQRVSGLQLFSPRISDA